MDTLKSSQFERGPAGSNPHSRRKSPSTAHRLWPNAMRVQKSTTRYHETATHYVPQYEQDDVVGPDTMNEPVSSLPSVKSDLQSQRISKIRTPRNPQKPRDEKGCLTCRLRKKGCPIATVDENKYCEPCRNLNIECLGYYGQRYPPGLRNKDRKQACLAKIKQHTKTPTSRRGPELSLNEFCGVPSPNVVTPRIAVQKADDTVPTGHVQPPEASYPYSQDTLRVPGLPNLMSTPGSSPTLSMTSTPALDSPSPLLGSTSDDASSVHTSTGGSLFPGPSNYSASNLPDPWFGHEGYTYPTHMGTTIHPSVLFSPHNYFHPMDFGPEQAQQQKTYWSPD